MQVESDPLFVAPSIPPTGAGATAVIPEVYTAGPGLTPWAILAFCVLAAVGTLLLLPGRRSVAWGRLGGGLLFVGLLLLAITMFLQAGYRNAYFWAFAAICILGSVRVVTHPQPVYSALYFVLTVFSSAGLFVLAYAEFMAVALITIYAGAILVTYTFVIMLAADAAPEETGVVGQERAAKQFLAEHDAHARGPIAASLIGFATAGVLLFVIFEKAPADLEKRLSLTNATYLLRPDPMDLEALDGEELEPTPLASLDETLPIGTTAALPVIAGQVPETGVRGDLYGYRNVPGYAQEAGPRRHPSAGRLPVHAADGLAADRGPRADGGDDRRHRHRPPAGHRRPPTQEPPRRRGRGRRDDEHAVHPRQRQPQEPAGPSAPARQATEGVSAELRAEEDGS